MTAQQAPQPPRQRTVAPCVECGETRIVAALRRCQGCYQALRRARPSEDRTNQRWTPEEDALLRRLAPSHTTQEIECLMRRPFWGVRDRMHTLRITALHARYGVEREIRCADIGAALGCYRETVEGWVARGYLAATVTSLGVWSISFDDLVAFLERGGVYLPSVCPVDPMWRTIVQDARVVADARLISHGSLATMLGVLPKTIQKWRALHRFPAPSWGGKGSRGIYYDRAAVAAWLAQHPHRLTAVARKEFDL